MPKTEQKKQYWRVDFGFRWERTSFLFSTAEDAAIFCENAAEHYSKILTDTENPLECTMKLLSEEEYQDLCRIYKQEHEKKEEQ